MVVYRAHQDTMGGWYPALLRDCCAVGYSPDLAAYNHLTTLILYSGGQAGAAPVSFYAHILSLLSESIPSPAQDIRLHH